MNSSENISGLYEDLDSDIMALYGLTLKQINTIKAALRGKNLFLKGKYEDLVQRKQPLPLFA